MIINNNMVKNFLNLIFKIFLFSWGLIIVAFIIWSRLIRERLPREIPFDIDILDIIFMCRFYISNIYLVTWRHYKCLKLQSITLGLIPSYANNRQIRITSSVLWTNTGERLFFVNPTNFYYISKRFAGTNKVTSTVVKAATDSTKITTPITSTNKNQVNVNRPMVSTESSNYNTNKGFNSSERNRENAQFLKKVDTLGERAEQANISAKVGVQNPFDYLRTVEQNEYSDNTKFFLELEKEGIIQYPAKNNDARLTEYGQQLYNRIQFSRNNQPTFENETDNLLTTEKG